MNNKQFLQTRGIPQGLCLSQILASFYYACLEDAELEYLRQSEESGGDLNCLMRFTDDYLLMTTSKDSAIDFIGKMFRLSHESDFKINVRKLKTSFHLDNSVDGPYHLNGYSHENNVDLQFCKWLGICIDT